MRRRASKKEAQESAETAAALIATAAQSELHDIVSLLRAKLTDSAAPCVWQESALRAQENRRYFDPLMGDMQNRVHAVLYKEFAVLRKEKIAHGATEEQATRESCVDLVQMARQHWKLEEALKPLCVLDWLPDGLGGWPEAAKDETAGAFSSRMVGRVERYIWSLGRFHDGDGRSITQVANPPSSERVDFVRRLLANKGWSVNDWAKNSRVDRKSAKKYLDGKGRTHPDTLKKLAASLDLNAENLPS